MESIQLLNLLRHMEQTAKCPLCKHSIFVENISILSSAPESAILHLTCPECKHEFMANVFLNFADISIGPEISFSKGELQMKDIDTAHETLLHHSGGISELFSSRS